MQGPELRAALEEQNVHYFLGSTALNRAQTRVSEAEQARRELIIQAGEEARDILVANEVEPDVRIMSEPKKGLLGHVKTPAQLQLSGWELDCEVFGTDEEGSWIGVGEERIIQRQRTILGGNGLFYTHYRFEPFSPDSKYKTSSMDPDEITNFGDGIDLAEKLARLLESVDDTATSQTT